MLSDKCLLEIINNTKPSPHIAYPISKARLMNEKIKDFHVILQKGQILKD